MKKVIVFAVGCTALSLFLSLFWLLGWSRDAAPAKEGAKVTAEPAVKNVAIGYPSFYRGIYLTVETARNPERFRKLVTAAHEAGINTVVIDVQAGRQDRSVVPAERVQFCLDLGIHPVARVVVFPGGLAEYPTPQSRIDGIIDAAEQAAGDGFREIQFDYIRFSDEGRHLRALRHVSLRERYAFVEGFIGKARARLQSYKVRVSVDVFGRVPHNHDDEIGQKLEVLDPIVDVISPMAYPSHYEKPRYYNDPYGTVKETSTLSVGRVKKAAVVPYIQAFKMRQPVGMAFEEYVRLQIQAVEDAKAGGFYLWNARQEYTEPLRAVAGFYAGKGR